MVLGDGNGPLMMYECVGGDPVADPDCWQGTDLLPGYTVNHGHSLAIADFNNDGALDIFNAEMRLNGGNSDAGMWIFLNDGSGNFTQTSVTTGIGNHESAVGDLDGDGDLDILGKPFNWETPRLDIWLNHLIEPSLPLDAWERHVIDSAKPWRAVFITAGDMNGDTLQDVITGGWVYLNPGDPAAAWARQSIGAPLDNMAAVFDFDSDGDLDVLGTEGIGAESNPNFVWAQNTGGSFTLHSNVPAGVGDFLQGVAVAPFQNGEQAIALSWHNEGVGIQTLTLPADPLNNSWVWQQIAPTGQGEALSAGDIDRDGDIDLLMGTQWLRNDGTGWTTLTLNPTAGAPDRNRLADINQDGRLDAVVGYEASSSLERLAWYEQPIDVNATWTEHIISSIISPMSLDVADMDRDGDWDVVVGEHNLASPASAGLFVFENLDGAGGSWAQHVIHVGDEHHDGAQVVDVDSDGDLDVVSIGWNHSNVLLYENLAINQTPPGPGAVLAPTNLSAAVVTDTQIDLAWTDNATDESSYRLERSPDGAAWVEFASLPANATAYSDTGLACGTGYHYRVRAYRASDGQFSAYSAASMTTTLPCSTGGRVTAGLRVLYDFEEGSGTTVHDVSGVGSPLDLTIDEVTSIRWLPGALAVDVPTLIVSATPATKIIDPVRASNAITIEAWLEPANVTQSGPARIVSLSYDLYNRDFTLGQGLWGTQPSTVFDVRLRTTATNLSGQPALTSPAGSAQTALTHVVYTRDAAGTARLYLNGALSTSATVGGNLSNWNTSYPLILANELTGNRPWLGTLHLVAVYDTALNADQVQQNFTAGVSAQLLPGQPDNLAASPADATTIDLTWADNATDESAYRVERSLDGGATWAEIAALPADSTAYSDTGLTCSTNYAYRVRAYRAADDLFSNYSNVISASTALCPPPDAPTGLNVTASSMTQLDLTWIDHAADESAYRIERSPDGGVTWAELPALPADSTSYSDIGLTCDTSYTYRVRAYRASDDQFSAYSNEASAITLACPLPPAPPTVLSATAVSEAQIDLTWVDNAANETAFSLERSPDGITWAEIASLPADTTAYSDTGLPCDTIYLYRVRAYRASDDTFSAYSNEASTLTLACPLPPAPPTALSATAVSDAQIDLTWVDNAADETAFSLERSPDGITWSEIASLPADTTAYSDTGLTCDTIYLYRVRAYRASDDTFSAYSNEASTLTLACPIPPPDTPTALSSVAASDTQIDLTWVDNATDESAYHVERSPDGVTWAEIATRPADATSYSDTGLTCGTSYSYRVRAYRASDDTFSAYSNEASALTLACPVPPPDAPTALNAVAGSDTQIDLTWVDNAADETAFSLERSPDGITWSEIASLPEDTTAYSDTGLTCDTIYLYRVRAYRTSDDTFSAYSNEASTLTLACLIPPPDAPTALNTVAASDTQIDLSWVDNATDESAYRVERSPDGVTWAEIISLPGNSTAYGDTGLTCDTSYTYRVRAYRASDDTFSAYSNEASTLTLACPVPPPDAPTALNAVAASDTQIDLSWVDNATDESTYRIERSPDGITWTEIADVPADSTAYGDTGLTCGTSYTYRVRAYRASDDTFSAYSNEASALTLPCPTGGRVTAGLRVLYDFEEGSGTTVHDVSGVGSPLDLTIDEVTSVRWLPGALAVDVPTLIVSASPATKIIDPVRASNAITIEAWLEPANVTQSGPARIVSLSYDLYNRDFTLGQGLWGTQPSTVFDVRLRTTATNLSGQPALTSPAGSAQTALTHVVYTRDAAGTARLYLNGALSTSATVGGNLSNWNTSYPLILANELTGNRPWLGTLHLVAVYDTALDAGQVQQNFTAGADSPLPPASPGNLSATLVGETTIDLAWTDNATDESQYRVERSGDGGSTWEEIASTLANVTIYSDGTLPCGAAFAYRVRAYRASDGRFSAYSNVASASTTLCPPPDAPTALSAVAGSDTQIDLSWVDNATDESGYRVERSPDGVTWAEITTLPADSTAYDDTGLTCGTSYTYRARAYRASDDTFSAYSNETSALTLACPIAPPDAPTALSAVAGSDTQIDLSWVDNATDESAYRIERSPDGVTWAEITTLPADSTSYGDTGLTCDTSYFHRVRAYRASDDTFSVYSNEASTLTLACPIPPPDAPTALNAVAASDTQIDLSWVDNATDESAYRVERSPDGLAWAEIASLPADSTAYSDTGLTCDTSYHYRVRAYRASDDTFSVYSNEASTLTLACTVSPPDAPTGLNAVASSDTRIDLSWVDNATDESAYRVERSPDGVTWAEIVTLPADSTSYSDTGLVCDTSFTYRVRAYRASDDTFSTYSNEASALTLACPVPPPDAPTALNAVAGSDTQIDLSWVDNATDESAYRIERSPNGATWTEIVTLPADSTSYSDTGLTCDTSYTYRVRAYRASDDTFSAYSNEASALTLACPVPPPDAPTALNAVAASDTQIDLSWVDNATDESAYRVERSPDGATWTEIVTLPADSTAYGDTGLTCDTSYTYRVRAYRASDDTFSTYSNEASALTLACPTSGRVTAGLRVLYDFEEGTGTTVHDVSGVGSPLDLTIDEVTSVRWLPGALAVDVPTLIVSATPATKIIDPVRASNAITIEAWLEPANVTQSGPARIVSLSYNLYNRNFTLGQGLWGTQPSTVFDVRLRTTTTNLSGQPALTSPAGTAQMALTHVVYTRDAAGTARLYLNGVLSTSATVGGNLSNWNTSYPLVLVNELTGDRPWLGTLHLVAVYDTALDADQVSQNFAAGVLP